MFLKTKMYVLNAIPEYVQGNKMLRHELVPLFLLVSVNVKVGHCPKLYLCNYCIIEPVIYFSRYQLYHRVYPNIVVL